MVSRELRNAGRHALIEFLLIELFGPLTLLVLRQAFVHEHPATTGPFVNWSISQVMLVGDTLLVFAVALTSLTTSDSAIHGELRRLPPIIRHTRGWWQLLVLTIPATYIGLVRADPFADQLALRPHAWIFQAGHVIFASFIGARLIYTAIQDAWSGIIRHRRPGPATNYCPPSLGGLIGKAIAYLLVAGYLGIYVQHPADYHLTTSWLHFG